MGNEWGARLGRPPIDQSLLYNDTGIDMAFSLDVSPNKILIE